MPFGRWGLGQARKRWVAVGRGLGGRAQIAALAVVFLLATGACVGAETPNRSPEPGSVAQVASLIASTPGSALAAASPSASAGVFPTTSPEPSRALGAADRLPGEPDPILTPGALNPAVTQATIGSTICVSGWTDTVRPSTDYTNALKIQQMAEYGYSDTSTSSYEEDHLIALELGGSPTDPTNLWPEPRNASLPDGRPTGASTKDVLETRLKNEVCSGAITLAEAQYEIGDHWVHVYYGIQPASSGASPSASLGPSPSASPSAMASDGGLGTGADDLPVRISSLPASVRYGSYATLVAITVPGAACSASVTYASGTISTAAGLKPRPTATSAGKVSWRWLVGSRTKPGVSTATVECWLGDGTGSASKDFRVTT
jgi:hypothetical protein